MDWSTTLQGARVRASATAPLKPFESICSTARLHLSDAQQPGLDTPHVQRAAAKVKVLMLRWCLRAGALKDL